MTIDAFSQQANQLVAENRRLLLKSQTDDETIRTIKGQYDQLAAGIENMVEDHRKIERDLAIRADKAERAAKEIEGLLTRAADLIMQAFRARDGDATPEKMPQAQLAHVSDERLPMPGPTH